MVKGLLELWSSFEEDPEVGCVVLRGAGGKALCAGGDVRAIYEMRAPPSDPRRVHAPAAALDFFAVEYRALFRLHTMSTPTVAFLDGLVMGGGCGVSINGRFRVATERSVIAMPECGIGLVPDVGGTRFLSAMPGETGTAMALTGRRVSGADARALGLATHLVRSQDLDLVVDALAAAVAGVGCGTCIGGARGAALADAVDECLREWESTAGVAEAGDLAPNRVLIDRWFAFDAVEDIVAALSAAAAATAATSSERQLAGELLSSMRAASPSSLKVALASLRRAVLRSPVVTVTGPGPEPLQSSTLPPLALQVKRSSPPPQPPPPELAACLRDELCAVAAALARDDFYEGVRARLVEKGAGAPPAWNPRELADVSEKEVVRRFEPETKEVEVVVRRFEAATGLAPAVPKVCEAAAWSKRRGDGGRGPSPRL
jgi:enoyl-CoA hydratase/carnithine racemase